MIHAQLQKSEYNEHSSAFSCEPLANLIVEDDGSHHGEHVERFGLSKAVLDPETHERVRFHEEPDRWLRLLPSAYRGGDLAIAILHDDHPYHPTAAGAHGHAVA